MTTLPDPITGVCKAVEARVRTALAAATAEKWGSSIMTFPVAENTFLEATRAAPHVVVMWRDARGGGQSAAVVVRLQLMVVLIVRAPRVEDLPIRANAAGVATVRLLHGWMPAIVLGDPESAPQPVGTIAVDGFGPLQVDSLRIERLTMVMVEASILLPLIDTRAMTDELPPFEGLDVDWRVASSALPNPQAIDLAVQEDTDG